MKKVLAVFAIASGLSVCAMAEDVTGYVIDKNCASNKKMLGDEACAKRCIGRGTAAVIATEEGKVYAVSNQDKVKELAGKKVMVTGKVDGESITVETIKAM